MLFTRQPLERVTRWRRWSLRLQNGLYQPGSRKHHSWWLSKFYMVRNTDCYLHRQRHKVLTAFQSSSFYKKITVRTLLDLSNSLRTLRSQRNFNRKKKLDSFRRRDRMILKQITPPKDIALLKSGLSLVSEEQATKSTAKLEVQVICGFFIHCVSVKKIIKAVKFQKVG